MAKIYETKEDFQRDKIEEQAQELHLKSERQSGNAMALMAASFIPAVFSKRPAWVDYLASAAGLIGLFEMIGSWRTRSRAHDLELERERMGPGAVVLPAGVFPASVSALEKDDCGCKHKKVSAIYPKTLTEFAEKPADHQTVR